MADRSDTEAPEVEPWGEWWFAPSRPVSPGEATPTPDHGSALAQIAGIVVLAMEQDGVCKRGDLRVSAAAAGAANAIAARPDLIAALSGSPVAETPAEPEDEEDGNAFFAAAMAEHGRCQCGVDADGTFCGDCALCAALPEFWPCPTVDHSGYPLPAAYEDGPFGGRFVDGVEVHWPPLRGDHALPMRKRHPVAPGLVEALTDLANPYGAMGVAIAAARLTHAGVLVRALFDDRETEPLAEPPTPSAECTPACSEMHRFEPGCALASPAVEGTTPTPVAADSGVAGSNLQDGRAPDVTACCDELNPDSGYRCRRTPIHDAGKSIRKHVQINKLGQVDWWVTPARALLAGGDPT